MISILQNWYRKLPIILKLDKPSAIFLGLAAILAVEIALFLPWGVTKLRRLNREIFVIQTKLTQFKHDWPKKSGYLEENAVLKEKINRISQKFFAPRQEASALSFISSESEKFAITVELLKPAEVKERASTGAGVFESLPVMVKAMGKFHNLARFLDYLQNSQYFFEVKKLDIFSGPLDNSIEIVICGLTRE